MIEIIISLCLLAFVVVRIRNLRRCHGFGVYAFPPVRPTKFFTTVYPGYIGGNARDRRKIKRKGLRVIPVEIHGHSTPLEVPFTPIKKKPQDMKSRHKSFPLRQKLKRTGAIVGG